MWRFGSILPYRMFHIFDEATGLLNLSLHYIFSMSLHRHEDCGSNYPDIITRNTAFSTTFCECLPPRSAFCSTISQFVFLMSYKFQILSENFIYVLLCIFIDPFSSMKFSDECNLFISVSERWGSIISGMCLLVFNSQRNIFLIIWISLRYWDNLVVSFSLFKNCASKWQNVVVVYCQRRCWCEFWSEYERPI